MLGECDTLGDLTMKILALACSAVLVAMATSIAQAADLPKPGWSSATDNMTYAVAGLCVAYVIDGKDPEALLAGQSMIHPDGWNESAFTGIGVKGVRVGFAGFIHAGMGMRNGHRECDITAYKTDPEALRAAMQAALAARPDLGFVPSVSKYMPGPWAAEDMLCGGPVHPNAFILASWSPPRLAKNSIAVTFTLSEGPRDLGCDQPNVQKNYRTLAQ
jgi:hypothetical protein